MILLINQYNNQITFINYEFGNTISDPEITANTFNNLFTSVFELYY